MGTHRAHRAGGTRTTSPGKKKMGEIIMTLHISEGLAPLSKQACLVQARRTELRLMLDRRLSERQRIRFNVRKKSSEHPLVFHRLLETAFPHLGIQPSTLCMVSIWLSFRVRCLPSSGHGTKPGQS